MKQKLAISVSFFIFVACNQSSVLAAAHQETVAAPKVCATSHFSTEHLEVPLVEPSIVYDEFDCIADDMAAKGVVPEESKELSRVTVLIRRIGGALLMRYLAVKAGLKKFWYWILRKPYEQTI